MNRSFHLAGLLAPGLFLLSVIVGGARRPGYSQLADPVSALGMSGAPDAWAINAAWTAVGLLIMIFGLALWRDRAGPGRVSGAALLVAGAASAAIAVWFPMDPPGVAPSAAQIGHNSLVGVAALAFAAALVSAARSPGASPAYRTVSWAALGAMGLGGAGAALSHAVGWPLIGAFERVTQAGYFGWILFTAATALWRRPFRSTS